MPALLPLVLVIKGFLLQRSLNDASKGGLGSYAIICMCISFLQVSFMCWFAPVLIWCSSFFIHVLMHSLTQANDRRNSSTNPSKQNHLDLYLPISFSTMVSSFHMPRHTYRSPKENSSQRRPCLGSNPRVATKNEYRYNVSSTQVRICFCPLYGVTPNWYTRK